MLSNHTGYETMIKHSGKIIHGLSTDPKEMATALHDKGFISDRILDKTYELPEINQDKGRRLYTAVLGVVENYPHRYKDFIVVLQQNTHLYSGLLEILNGHGELEQNSRPEAPASKRQRISDGEQSSSIVSVLSGTPTLDELCSLPIEKVWHPLGLWLGVEESELQWIKQSHLQHAHVEMLKAFLEDIKNTHEYEQVISALPDETKEVAKELFAKEGPLETNEFELVIGELPRKNLKVVAKELLAKKASKSYGQLVRALVKVGKKKVAEEICSNKGKLYLRQIICHYYRRGSTRNRN